MLWGKCYPCCWTTPFPDLPGLYLLLYKRSLQLTGALAPAPRAHFIECPQPTRCAADAMRCAVGCKETSSKEPLHTSTGMMRPIFLTALMVFAGCNGQSSGAATANDERTLQLSSDLERAVQEGRVRIEVRGLQNTSSPQSYGGTTFMHKATVVATGDSILSRRPFFVLFTVKRISGGDPGSTRGADENALVSMSGGIGEFAVGGGYRTSAEKWEPEKIEITPVAIIPAAPIKGTSVREQ